MRTHCSVSVRILSLISSLPVMVSADTSTTAGPASGDTLHSLTSKFPPKVSSLFAAIVPAHSFNFAFALGTRRALAQHHIKFRFASQARRPADTAIFLALSCHVCAGGCASPQPPAVFFCSPRSCVKKTLSVLGWFVWSIKAGSPAGTSRHSTKGFSPCSR
jgi:hypothetical protein